MTDEKPPGQQVAGAAGPPRSGGAFAPWAAVVLLFGGAILTTQLAFSQSYQLNEKSAASMSGLLLAGAVTFFLAVGGVVALFRALDLQDPGHPLGLPEGTVHALIALILVFLFFVIAVFLYLDVSQTTTDHWVRNLTAEELANVEGQILNQYSYDVPTGSPDPEGHTPTEKRYDVLIAAPRASSQVAEDIARQLVTSLGTLIAAIAAFYFGAKSVAAQKPPEGGT